MKASVLAHETLHKTPSDRGCARHLVEIVHSDRLQWDCFCNDLCRHAPGRNHRCVGRRGRVALPLLDTTVELSECHDVVAPSFIYPPSAPSFRACFRPSFLASHESRLRPFLRHAARVSLISPSSSSLTPDDFTISPRQIRSNCKFS